MWGAFRPRDVAEVGGGLGAFVGLPAEVAADRPRIDRASLACAVVFAASKRRSVWRPDIGMRWTRCPLKKVEFELLRR